MSHEKLKRFGVSIEGRLLERFDKLIARRGYTNRSEAFRDFMRQALVEETWEDNVDSVGTVTLVYDHDDPGLEGTLTKIQHRHHDMVVSGMHSHLNHHDCLEVIILRGKARQIAKLADELISARGVKHGKLVMTAAGAALA